MTSRSFNTLQASLKLKVLFWMLRAQGAARGIGQHSLRRVEAYLRISLGLQSPRYTETLQRPKQFFSGLTAKPWHEPADYQWTAELEAGYDTIKAEFSDVYAQDGFRRQHQGLDDKGQWDVYYLFFLGRKAEDHCRQCPRTTRLISSIPEVSNSGLVYFSVLTAGTHIAPHCGPLNTRLRCHLGLAVPDHCRIRVGTETRTWKEGKCLVFDDSFEHEVWNASQTSRAVLIVDFWHPDLTPAESWALEQVMKLSPEARRYAKAVLRKGARV